MTTTIKKGDLVWITANDHSPVPDKALFGVVMNKIDENWFRIYSSYWTSCGEKTNIQDFPSQMLRRVSPDENRRAD